MSRQCGRCRSRRVLRVSLGKEGELASLPMAHARCRLRLPLLLWPIWTPRMSLPGKHQGREVNTIEGGSLQLSNGPSASAQHQASSSVQGPFYHGVTTVCVPDARLASNRSACVVGRRHAQEGDDTGTRRCPTIRGGLKIRTQSITRRSNKQGAVSVSHAFAPNFELYHPRLSRCKPRPSFVIPRPNGRGLFLGALPRVATLRCQKHAACVHKAF